MTAFVLHLMRFSEVCGKYPRGCDLIKIKSRPIVYTVYMTVYRKIVNGSYIFVLIPTDDSLVTIIIQHQLLLAFVP